MKPAVVIPRSHRDLLTRSLRTALATMGSDGFPCVAPVECDLDGTDLLVHLTAGSTEADNLAPRSAATVLAVDPDDGGRWIEVRGDAISSVGDDGGAVEHPGAGAISWRIRPTRVNLDAIHH